MSRTWFRGRTLWLALLLMLPLAGPAYAQQFGCSIVQAPSLDFGQPAANPTGATATTSSIGVRCEGNGGERGLTIKVCVGLTPSGRSMTATGGAALAYQVYRDPARTVPWGANADGRGVEVTAKLDMSVKPTATINVPVYASLVPGQTGLPAGTYTHVDAGGQVNSGDAVGTPCSGLPPRVNFSTPARATVLATCTIAATPLAFGTTAALATTAVTASTDLALSCTAGAPYSVRLDEGQSGTGARAMKSGGSGAIAYDLFIDPTHSQRWGNGTAGAQVSGTGTGSAQVIRVHGKVPAQPMPAAGTYTDTITATIEY